MDQIEPFENTYYVIRIRETIQFVKYIYEYNLEMYLILALINFIWITYRVSY